MTSKLKPKPGNKAMLDTLQVKSRNLPKLNSELNSQLNPQLDTESGMKALLDVLQVNAFCKVALHMYVYI